MEDFKITVIGAMPLGVFLGYLFIACFVALFAMGVRANKKRKITIDTPDNFSFIFLLKDNALSLLLQLGVIVLSIRFCNETMGQEATGWVAALIGFGSNKATLLIEKFQGTARD